MDRRTFLKTTGAATLRSTLLLATSQRGKPREAELKNWTWVPADTSRSSDDWKRQFAIMRQHGIQAILAEIYNGHRAFFASTRLPVEGDWLDQILPLAKAEGLEVHAWMWSMPCMLKDILANHRDWYNVNAKGESAAAKPAYADYYRFLDPGRPEVREFVQGTVKELARIPELTGIHLDYIRHPDAILPRGLWSKYKIVQDKIYPQYDYGYSEYERNQFKKKYGVDPLQLKDPNSNQDWVRFRLDSVVDLVNDYLVPAAHAEGKMITAAVFPGPSLAREMVRQDWGRFQLDAFLPMLYNVFYEQGPEWVRRETEEGVAATGKPIYSGLFVNGMDGPTFLKTLRMAIDGGAAGVSIFSASAMDQSKWTTLLEAIGVTRKRPL
jgi:uncharacterized lipoprotein YddW (UPF0748 family)